MTIFVIPSEGGAPVQATAEQVAQIREQLGARSAAEVTAAVNAGVSAHAQVADPHSQYLTQARGDQRYSQPGHTHPYVQTVNGQAPVNGDVQIAVGGPGGSTPLVNDLTTGGATSALAAAQGPVLAALIGAKQNDLGLANVGALNAAVDARADARITAQKGNANGLVPLGADNKIAATYLPGYVDDVLEFANLASFPTPGEGGKLYVDLSTSPAGLYRWSGSAYVSAGGAPQYASQAEAEAGTENTKTVTALRVAQAIAARAKDALLTGWTVGSNAVVAAGDSIATAFGKLQGQINAISTALAGKPDALAPANITNATSALTLAANANRQNRWFGNTLNLVWPNDGGTSDISAEFVELPGSPGHLTITLPGGLTITTNPNYAVGFQRIGGDLYVTGSTNPNPAGGATNLSFSRDATTLTINSSTGSAAVIPLASSTQAGLLSPAEKLQIGAAAAAEPLTVTGSTPVGSVLTAAPNGNWIITPGQWYTRSGPGGATLTPIAAATALTFNTTGRTAGDQITYKPDNIAFAPAGITLTAAVAAPTLSGFTISNASPGTMTFNSSQALTSADITGTGGLSLTLSDGAITVTAIDVNGTGPHTATLSRNVGAGATGTVSYVPGSSSAPFASAAGSVAAFSNVAITNNVAASSGITVEDSRVALFSDVGDGVTANMTAVGANRALFAIAASIYGANTVTDIKRGGSAGTSLTRLGADLTFMFGGAGAAAFGAAGAIPSPTNVFGDWGNTPPHAMVGAVLLSGVHQTTPFSEYGSVPVDNGNEINSMNVDVTIEGTTPGGWYLVGLPWGSGTADATGADPVAGTTLIPNSAASGLGGMLFMLKQATGTSLLVQSVVNQGGTPNFISSRAFWVRVNPA